ncbi:MAG: hypothetical protein PVI23_08165 [Maricaulaceae bacterium]|jgi:phenylacetate-coenzyme A ligase PaaK-like adenylate-forming protein
MFADLPAIVGKLTELRYNAKLTRAELEATKLKKFRKLAAKAEARSPYYREIIKSRDIDVKTCKPADFPVLTKSDLMTNFDRIVTDRRVTKAALTDFLARSNDPRELFLGKYRVLRTSGTSGKMGIYVFSTADWMRGFLVSATRMQGRAGAQGRRRRLALYGVTEGHFAGASMATTFMQVPMRMFIKAEFFNIADPISQSCAKLNAFQPDLLTSYPSALAALAERQLAGELKIAPLAVAASGETVTKADLQVLQDAFKCDVGSSYSCSEHLLIGLSSEDNETMTLFDNDLIFEFHDDHIIVTNLFNTTQPLIRYRMDDVLTPVKQSPGARELVIRSVVGRSEYTPSFVNEDGARDIINTHTISTIFVDGVRQFQLRVTGEASFEVLARLEDGLSADASDVAISGLRESIAGVLRQRRMSNVAFEVTAVDKIDHDPVSRKFKLIVDARRRGEAQS